VIQSPFEQTALKDLNLTVDYYDIAINDAIAPATTETTYQECFNAYGTNPSYDPNNSFCKLILRSNVNGFWLATDALYSNLGAIKTSGVDSAVDWKMPAPGFGNEPGMFFANVNFNYLLKYDVQNVAGGVVLHYANTIGAPITAPPYGAQFRWKLFTTLGYRIGPAAISANWRHMPSVNNIGLATDPTSKAVKTASYDEIDMSALWSVTTNFDIRFGVDNLTDKQPPTVGAIPGSTNSAGVTDIAGSYDVIGRRYYLGFTARL
jgi:outer membrane receptor protein involved in Fe transport